MVSEKEKKAFFDARNRAVERRVEGEDFVRECVAGFCEGMMVTTDPPSNRIGTGEVLSETNFAFAFVAGVCIKVEAKKGKGYAASWQKRGWESAKANIDRKFDRITAILENGEGGESLTTNLADLAVYCLKGIALQNELNPEEFSAWINEVRNLSK